MRRSRFSAGAAIGLLASAALATALSVVAPSTAKGAATLANQRWEHVTFCSSLGTVGVDLPGPVEIEGPRPLRHLAEPTVGTFARSYGSDLPLRYDAFLIDHAEQLGTTDARRLAYVLRHLDGDPNVVTLHSITTSGSNTQVEYEEVFNDRYLYAYGFARKGVIVVVNVGILDGSPDRHSTLGRLDLDRIRASIDLTGFGQPTSRPCDGATH